MSRCVALALCVGVIASGCGAGGSHRAVTTPTSTVKQLQVPGPVIAPDRVAP